MMACRATLPMCWSEIQMSGTISCSDPSQQYCARQSLHACLAVRRHATRSLSQNLRAAKREAVLPTSGPAAPHGKAPGSVPADAQPRTPTTPPTKEPVLDAKASHASYRLWHPSIPVTHSRAQSMHFSAAVAGCGTAARNAIVASTQSMRTNQSIAMRPPVGSPVRHACHEKRGRDTHRVHQD